MFYIGNRASDDAVSATAGIDTSDRGLCNHLQGEYQLTVRFGLFGSNRYGIPELFGREASFIDDRIDRLQPVVGPQNGIARLVLEIDDVEQILHVGVASLRVPPGLNASGETVVTFFTRRMPPLRVTAPSSAGASIASRRPCKSSRACSTGTTCEIFCSGTDGGWGTSSVVKSLVQPTSNPKIASSDKYFMFFISN